ncbi:MerR family DNA-binding transcriptional regulator [Amycolatopsis plumensis]|uniref:MerR family DNA-binding transcriptional regulator n=1 Tax=Amycolatopsis plumensis TaxID=236508 RepID=A0ABV5UEQ0_9PSEU
MNMVSIGEFSRLSRLSAKALRLYGELGLLVPAHVDAETGYRWYAVTQLDHARLVASLRRAEVPLARIRTSWPWTRHRPPRRSGSTGPTPKPSTPPGAFWWATSLITFEEGSPVWTRSRSATSPNAACSAGSAGCSRTNWNP